MKIYLVLVTEPGVLGAVMPHPPTSGGLLDSLKKSDEQQQQAPAAPSGPQAPRSQ